MKWYIQKNEPPFHFKGSILKWVEKGNIALGQTLPWKFCKIAYKSTRSISFSWLAFICTYVFCLSVYFIASPSYQYIQCLTVSIVTIIIPSIFSFILQIFEVWQEFLLSFLTIKYKTFFWCSFVFLIYCKYLFNIVKIWIFP